MTHITISRNQVKQWLEALQDIDALHHPAEPESGDAMKAIADMKQALAQPEQELVATVQCIHGITIGYLEIMQPVGTKLYTAPPQRPWVGLMRGVRVEGDTVVIKVQSNNEARLLCSELVNEMEKNT
jgi:hypothetical protein